MNIWVDNYDVILDLAPKLRNFLTQMAQNWTNFKFELNDWKDNYGMIST